MSSPWERHARYYLAAIQAHIEDWWWLEVELPNIRTAWRNVREKSHDPALIIAFGELAWKCYDLQERRLFDLLRSIETRQSLESKLSSVPLDDFARQLSEIARLAQLTSSALSPSNLAGGERSVASASIVNSIVITGDNAIMHFGQAREHSSTPPCEDHPSNIG